MAQEVGAVRRWGTVIILSLAAFICAADQKVPYLLIEPIKAEMHFSDSQVASIVGVSFLLAYTLASIPIAWIADRSNRRLLIFGAVTIWCSMTVLGGYARDFNTLFIARMGVGVGEAALMPTAYSLLADLFPASRLVRPLAVISTIGSLGSVLSQAIGGALDGWLEHAHLSILPAFAPQEPWRLTTIAIGGVGLVIAVLALFMPEPREHAVAGPKVKLGDGINIFVYLGRQWRFFVPLVIGFALYGMFAAAVNGWLAPLFMRNFGWPIAKAGYALALMSAGATLGGPVLGVVLVQIVQKWRGRTVPLLAMVAAMILMLPCICLAATSKNPIVAITLMTFGIGLSGALAIIFPVVLTSVSPSHLRARVVAAVMTFGGLIAALGPLEYAAFNDNVMHDPKKLGMTIAILTPVMIVLAVSFITLAQRRYAATSGAALKESVFPTVMDAEPSLTPAPAHG